MLICTHSNGHYPNEYFDIPQDLFSILKEFSNEFPVWSDCYDSRVEELADLLQPYKIGIPTFCTYS